MAHQQKYDAIIVGSGQGGTPLCTALAGQGMRTAIVEERNVGGTCVNYGCTPTKTMVASARVAHLAHRGPDYGVETDSATLSVRLSRVRERKRNIVASFRGGSERRIAQSRNATLVRGSASFLSPHTLAVAGADGEVLRISAPKIFINTGTRPALPELDGLPTVDYLDNESIMELETVPAHLLVLGGGYVGAELAQMFRRFGSEVTIIQTRSHLLPREDPEISEAVAALFRSEGIEVLTETRALSVQPVGSDPAGPVECRVRVDGGVRSLTASRLLVATGRQPNTASLGLEHAGVPVDERGYVVVNDRLETDVDGIWALGDVKGGPAFTHVSYDDYRVLYRNIVENGDATIVGRLVPYTVFIDPPLGRVGLTERAAREAGEEVRVASMPMSWVARALETDETSGLMKAVVDAASGRILGFAMLGIDGGEVAGAVQIAMMGGLSYTALRDAIFSHPTTMESLNNLFAGLN